MQTHGVLRHLALDVPRGEVAQRAHGGLGDLLAVARRHHRAHQRVHAARLAHRHLRRVQEISMGTTVQCEWLEAFETSLRNPFI